MLPDPGTGNYATALLPRALYNGNIPTMLTALRDTDGDLLPLHANVYHYDRLNRIKAQNVFKGTAGSSLLAFTDNEDYHTAYSYDPNGNILSLLRNGHSNGVDPEMDELSYTYTPGTNQLEHVDDVISASNYGDDLDDQNAANYEYDEKGRLEKDAQAGIGQIQWNLQDKVRHVLRVSTDPSAPNLEFRYGPTGHRVVKVVKPRSSGTLSTEDQWTSTYYIHDAQGNPMAIYRRFYQPDGANYKDRLQLDGLPIYGSVRLGMHSRTTEHQVTFSTTGFTTEQLFADRNYSTFTTPVVDNSIAARTLGTKTYELSNHLGNVLTTISDRRLAVPDGTDPTLCDHYLPQVTSTSDYFPFGSLLPGRTSNPESYRFGFNRQEKDDELNGGTGNSYDFGARLYDSRVGRFLSLDKFGSTYPEIAPYSFAGDNPINFIDFEGHFRIDSDLANAFPALVQVLNAISSMVEGQSDIQILNNPVIQQFVAASGITGKPNSIVTQVKSVLQNGQGPFLTVHTYAQNPRAGITTLAKGPGMPTGLYDVSILNDILQATLGSDIEGPMSALSGDQAFGLLALFETLLHEGVHVAAQSLGRIDETGELRPNSRRNPGPRLELGNFFDRQVNPEKWPIIGAGGETSPPFRFAGQVQLDLGDLGAPPATSYPFALSRAGVLGFMNSPWNATSSIDTPDPNRKKKQRAARRNAKRILF
jgi:RHS repeat-associated protein